jgi:hypothetical protein
LIKDKFYKEKTKLIGPVDILVYEDVFFKLSQNNSTLNLKGNWFIIDCAEEAYYHFLVDNVGQFYALKEKIQDLNLLIRITDNTKNIEYISWCLDKLVKENEAVFIEAEKMPNVYIENLYACSTRLIPMFHLIDKDVIDLIVVDEYQKMVIPELRKFFLRNLPKYHESKKIYAIRRSKSQELDAKIEYLDYLSSNGVSWNNGIVKDPNKVLENIPLKFKTGIIANRLNGRLHMLEMDTKTRYISNEDETMLEEFLIDKGYKFFSHLNISYENQMSMIASCKSYACITGASALNAIVCPEDASIFIINPDTNWPMPNHEYAVGLVNDNAHTVFTIKDFPNQRFTMDQVISKLRELM